MISFVGKKFNSISGFFAVALSVVFLCMISCVSNTWRSVDELSKTYTGYVRTGSHYETKKGSYERVLAGGEYELSVPFGEKIDDVCYYRVLSPAKEEKFVRIEKQGNGTGYDFVKGAALLSRKEVEALQVTEMSPPKQKKSVDPDKVFERDFVVLEEKRSWMGKMTLPLVYVDAVVVDVPLTLAGLAVNIVQALVSPVTGLFDEEAVPEQVED